MQQRGVPRIGSGARDAPAGRRPRLARLCRRTGLLPLAGAMRQWVRGGDVRILAYHRVLESVEPAGFSFDVDLISASAEAFEAQMRHVRRHFHPMRFDELADCLDRGRRPPPRALLVSFDDGYDDNCRIAFPILRDLGLSAMFFVSTGHIHSGRPYAYDWLVHMVCSAPPRPVRVPELRMALSPPEGLEARRDLVRELLDRLKALPADAQLALVARLERDWAMPREAGHPGCRPMCWEQLRRMQADGMEIGSHGVGHHMLSKLPEALMREEVAGSKRMLDRELPQPAVAISYPVGGPDAYGPAVMAAAREAGYRLACSYRAGTDPATADSRYQMRRLPVERQMDGAWFEATMALPELFGYRSRRRNG